MDGWIKLHRKMIEWEWYNDNNTKVVFLHLLLTANHKDKKWQGITIKRGQKITSLQHLAEETNLTIRQVRTSLSKLKSTSEITIKSTNKFTLVTIEKYSDYQDRDEENDKQNDKQDDKRMTNERQTNDKQTTTNKNEKNDKNDKNKKEVVEEKLQQLFIKCTNSTNLNAIEECISYLDDFSYEVIENALKKASEKNGGWKYAKAILRSWQLAGIKTIEQVEAEEKNFKKSKDTGDDLEKRVMEVLYG